jgi:hypothetical protein
MAPDATPAFIGKVFAYNSNNKQVLDTLKNKNVSKIHRPFLDRGLGKSVKSGFKKTFA